MTFKFLLIAVFFALTNVMFSSNQIIIKFKENSPEYQKIKNNQELDISAFNLHKVISIKTLVNDANLSALQNLDRKNALSLSKQSNYYSNLKRIFIIEYDDKINAELLSTKIKTHSSIDYAEAMPKREFFAVPNDPEIAMQYHLERIKAFESWNFVADTVLAIVAVVDTGVDYLHEDLAANIWQNPNETGIDEEGNDKQSNGIDDDNNGYIDDSKGWDFVGNGEGEDNNPMNGNEHGTHVAGIVAAVSNNEIGISGVSKNVKILPVKISTDSPFDRSVANQFNGVLYAGLMKAEVINCSWGGVGSSESEQEIINTVNSMGSLVVAAAGNDGANVAFFPASYNNVVSVASSNELDVKSGFSNYDATVDISAPGSNIYSTVPSNLYSKMSGTSMASPVVAGVAAMLKTVHRDYDNAQITEHLKATSDYTDTLNYPTRYGKIGAGRINALRALSEKEARSVTFLQSKFIDANYDNFFEANEDIELEITLQNLLLDATNLKLSISSSSVLKPIFEKTDFVVGDIAQNEIKSIPEKIKFKISPDVPINYLQEISLKLTGDNGLSVNKILSFYVKPSYRTMSHNNISSTFNNVSNFAYNDFPSNLQGNGFRYKNGQNLLFEGSLMLVAAGGKLSNNARNDGSQDYSFKSNNVFDINKENANTHIGSVTFQDFVEDRMLPMDSMALNVIINQNVYQSKDLADAIIVTYDIKNTNETNLDSVYAGLYFDWDIGISGGNNVCYWNDSLQSGIALNEKVDSLPKVIVNMYSGYEQNFYAIDNDGESADNIGVYDGFDREEKIRTMTNGLLRKQSSSTDISMLIAGGPFRIEANKSKRISFIIGVSQDEKDLAGIIKSTQDFARNNQIDDGVNAPLIFESKNVYPNPSLGNDFIFEYGLDKDANISLSLYDLAGKEVKQIYKNISKKAGYYIEKISSDGLAKGVYFLHLNTGNEEKVFKLIVSM